MVRGEGETGRRTRQRDEHDHAGRDNDDRRRDHHDSCRDHHDSCYDDNNNNNNHDHLPMCRNGYLLSLRGFSVSRAVLDTHRKYWNNMHPGLPE